MKITRYYQSCLLIEERGARILIDPSGEEAGRFDSFGKLDAVLYTHEHGDHFEPELAQKFADAGAAIYANASTVKQMKFAPNIVTDGQEFKIGDVSVKVLELPHCLMADGSAGPQNTGYSINQKLFHPGDGKELAGLQVENLAVPIAGPDVSIKDAFGFAKQVGAKKAIPIHYDYIGTKPEVFEQLCGYFNPPFQTLIIEQGKSTEI